MIKRYLVSMSGKRHYITKFYIVKIDNILRFGYDIYILSGESVVSIIKSINQSFINNPESDSIFERLPKELRFSKNISQLDALDIITQLEHSLSLGNTNQFIQVRLPDAVLYYEYNKTKLLYNFIKYFYDNYELIKLNIDKLETKQDKKSQPTVDSTLIKSPIQDINSQIFEELIKLSPNNILTFFILKQLVNNYTNQEVVFNIDENEHLNISLTKITNNLMLLYNDLMVIINFKPNNISEENYKTLIKTRIGELIKLIRFIYQHKEEINVNNLYLFLNFILIALYTYGFWLNNSDLNSGPNLYGFVNKILLSLKKTNSILFIPLDLKQNENVTNIELGKINQLASKYKYLIEIDRSRFINNIINDTRQSLVNKYPIQTLPISKAKLLNLASDRLPLNYQYINDKSLDSHLIISKPYHSLLILENSQNIFNLDEFDENFKKLISIVQTKLIPSVNKVIEQIKLNPSTLFIYNECIVPNINTQLLSIKEQFYLLYEIIIPYIFDTFKINKFLDHFH